MPTVVKHQYFFRSAEGYGWQEVHYRSVNTTGLNLATLSDYSLANIVPARVALLGEDCSFIGQRLSYKTVNGISSYNTDQNIGSGNTHPGAAPALCISVAFVNAFFTKKKITKLRGFWDEMERDEALTDDPVILAQWQPLFLAWKAALIAGGFGWPTRDTTAAPKGNVTNYAVSPTGIVTFTVSGSQQLTDIIGQTVSVAFARINNSKSVLNQTLVCYVDDANTLKTVAPIAALSFDSPGTFRVRLTTFEGYANTGGIKLGRRAMGKPTGLSRGRSRARART